ncbi:SRPBCC family protein [Ramlibacter sp. Leaf400]|uniref:SRPBCC family protein n=1 Tax=Ramlibacter sp. Leaf400 TaxID=1736365 RepID=UPI000B28C65E|nr:SRPBCC family protein [Ramlibacter sp. Leaf400]
MQANFPRIAAYVAGGLFLSHMLRGRPSYRDEIDYEFEADTGTELPLATIALAAAGFVAGGVVVTRYLHARRDGSGMSTVEESIDLNVPVSTAYNQWTQFEEFPRFMASVEQVRQVDDTHLHWRAVVAGRTKEWDSEITEQIPDQRIAWRSTGGATNAGVVTFHRIDDRRSRVMLQMDYRPETTAEVVGDTLGGVRFTTKGNLKRFKKLVEARGQATGAWRGTVTQH